MKQTIKLLVFTSVFVSLLSFTNLTDSIVGTYGVTENNPNKIELKLNADKTFTYKDFSNMEKQIDVTGNWELKNNTVLLKDYQSDFSFHNKWKIKNDGQIATARKGLTFYTLMKL
jgi:uncharacterized protein (DUF2147 family)